MRIEYEFDASQERIENGFEELLFALGTENEEKVREELYERVGQIYIEQNPDLDSALEQGQKILESNDDFLPAISSMYAQNLGQLLEYDSELRDGFYDKSLDERLDYMKLGHWTEESPLSLEST